MTIIQKRVRLFSMVLAFMLATVSYGWAQERPRCPNAPGSNPPGVCFLNADDLNDVFAGAVEDEEGNLVVLTAEFTSADDFVRTNRDGSLFIHFTDSDTELIVFTSTGGMLFGSGRTTANVNVPAFCPLTLSIHGTATDGLTTFNVSVNMVSRPDEGEASGCALQVNNINIGMQN